MWATFLAIAKSAISCFESDIRCIDAGRIDEESMMMFLHDKYIQYGYWRQYKIVVRI